MLLTACTQEERPLNRAPQVGIALPGETLLQGGLAVPLRVSVEDEDAPAGIYMRVFVDGERICERQMVENPEVCTWMAPPLGGTFLATAQVFDSEDVVGEGFRFMTLRPAPSPEITLLLPRQHDAGTEQTLQVRVDMAAEVSVWSDLDGVVVPPSPVVLALPQPPGLTQQVQLSQGMHRLAVTAVGALGMSSVLWTDVEVRAPIAGPQVPQLLVPSQTTAEGPLVARLAQHPLDVDGLPTTLRWSWSSGGPTVSGRWLDRAELRKGDTWQLSVRALDVRGRESASEAEVVVVNAPPTLHQVWIERTGEQLWCRVHGEDVDGDVVTIHRRWLDGDGLEVGTEEQTTAGGVRRCVVTLDDGDGGLTEGEATVRGSNDPPVVVVEVPGPVWTHQAVEAVVQVSGGETRAVSWWVDGAVVAEGSTLPPGLVQVGDRLEVLVEASDGVDVAWARSEPVWVGNTPPEPPVAELVMPTTPGGVAHCAVEGADPDGDALTYTVRLEPEGAGARAWPGDELDTRLLDRGLLRCHVGADDGIDRTEGMAELPVRPCDADGDGYASLACGGDDCDDGADFVHPGAPEQLGLAMDLDCDGMFCDSVPTDEVEAVVCTGVVGRDEAQELCRNGGWDSLGHAEDSAAIHAFVQRMSGSAWVSGARDESTGWRWSHGLPVVGDAWAEEPADGVWMGLDTDGSWRPLPQDATLGAFICERR